MTSSSVYSEQSKLEMEKFLIDLAVKLIEKGYWYKREDGITERMELTISNIYKLQEELRATVALYIFAF